MLSILFLGLSIYGFAGVITKKIKSQPHFKL